MRVPCVLFAVTLAALGCERDAAPSPGAVSAKTPHVVASILPPAATHAAAVERCRPVGAAASFTLGPALGELPAEDEEPLALPNAVEIGEATRAGARFAVSFLLESGGQTHAHLAMVSAEADAGHVVDLGRVYGMVPPPRIAPSGSAVLVAIADGDVNELAARIARVEGDLAGSRVSAGSRLPQGNDESPVFGLAVGNRTALLVWDQWDAKGRGEILGAGLDVATGALLGEPRRLSDEGADAEGPRVLADEVGFWVAWVENAPLSPKQKKKIDEDIAPGVALGARWVRVARTDGSGSVRGQPVQVTPEEGTVLGFDLAATTEGALLVWRDDATSPATPGGRVLSARLRDDGTFERAVVAEDDVGPGEPILLSGGSPEDTGLLAFAGEDDGVRIAFVEADGRIGEPLRERGLRGGMPLALAGDRLLVATPRGRSAELTVVTCRR